MKSKLSMAFAEALAIASWRSQWLREHYNVAAERIAWEVGIRLEAMRQLGSSADSYQRRINALHRKLGVPGEYGKRRLPFQREASNLVPLRCGMDGKQRWMTPETAKQWLAMQAAAADDGITLLVRDAFRGVDDQAWLIRQELLRGEDVGQVLSAIAAPGYSQHHTGQALDIERIPAGADFETTAAFEWLCRNAAEYGFELSYPRDNPYGIMYEPWHWYCNIENTPDRS